MAVAKIIRPTSGNTVDRVEQWSLTSGWVGNGKVPNGSWATSKESCRVMGTGLTTMSAEPEIVHAACWAHARRKFFEAVKLHPKDQTSIRIVAQMDELFAIDAQAREQNLSQTGRHLLRLEKAKPLLEQIKREIEAARAGGAAQERHGQGLQLHADALATAHPLPGASSIGVKQQLG